MQTIPMTPNGVKALEDELNKLISEDRDRIISDIATARSHGDLKENAEYHAAKEEQGFIESRIKEIEAKLSNAQIIDPTKLVGKNTVIFSAHVVLENIVSEQKVCYQIVGEDEADIKCDKISCYSPVARALIGKSLDDKVIVKAPNGDITYIIVEIKYSNE